MHHVHRVLECDQGAALLAAKHKAPELPTLAGSARQAGCCGLSQSNTLPDLSEVASLKDQAYCAPQCDALGDANVLVLLAIAHPESYWHHGMSHRPLPEAVHTCHLMRQTTVCMHPQWSRVRKRPCRLTFNSGHNGALFLEGFAQQNKPSILRR